MPLFEVTFMNHITTTHLVEADDEDAAWETEPEDVERGPRSAGTAPVAS